MQKFGWGCLDPEGSAGTGPFEYLFICLLIVKHLVSFGDMVITERNTAVKRKGYFSPLGRGGGQRLQFFRVSFCWTFLFYFLCSLDVHQKVPGMYVF